MTPILQFSAMDDIGSWLIRWFSHERSASHVDLVLPDGRLLGARSEAVDGIPAGVRIRPPGYLPFTRVSRFGVRGLTDDAESRLFQFAYSQLGKPYDRTAIWGFVAGRNWRAEDAWFCSELVAACFEHAGFPLIRAGRLSKVTPGDLLLSPYLTRASATEA